MANEKVREVQERRRSSAASPQDRRHSLTDKEAVEEQLDDDEWLYGNSPAGLRMRAAQELAREFDTDIEEWLV